MFQKLHVPPAMRHKSEVHFLNQSKLFLLDEFSTNFDAAIDYQIPIDAGIFSYSSRAGSVSCSRAHSLGVKRTCKVVCISDTLLRSLTRLQNLICCLGTTRAIV